MVLVVEIVAMTRYVAVGTYKVPVAAGMHSASSYCTWPAGTVKNEPLPANVFRIIRRSIGIHRT